MPRETMAAVAYTFPWQFNRDAYPPGYLAAPVREEVVVTGAVARLRALGAHVVVIDSGGRAWRSRLQGRGVGALGVKGLPDIAGTHADGRAIWIEAKRPAWIVDGRVRRPAGKPTPEQLAFLHEVHRRGACAGVIWRATDVDEIVRPWPLDGP